jgi:hypothetical protein
LPLLTIPPRQDQILISKILVGRKTSEVVEYADESSFGEVQQIWDKNCLNEVHFGSFWFPDRKAATRIKCDGYQ